MPSAVLLIHTYSRIADKIIMFVYMGAYLVALNLQFRRA